MLIGGKINAALATLQRLINDRPRLQLRGLAGGRPHWGGFRFAMQNQEMDLELVVFRAQAAGGFWRVLTQSRRLSLP